VASARKLTVLCWLLVTKGEDYAFARPSLNAHKRRKLELAAGATSAEDRSPGHRGTTTSSSDAMLKGDRRTRRTRLRGDDRALATAETRDPGLTISSVTISS